MIKGAISYVVEFQAGMDRGISPESFFVIRCSFFVKVAPLDRKGRHFILVRFRVGMDRDICPDRGP